MISIPWELLEDIDSKQEIYKKIINLLEQDKCREAEELARLNNIEINYEYADEGRIYIDDECMTFDVD